MKVQYTASDDNLVLRSPNGINVILGQKYWRAEENSKDCFGFMDPKKTDVPSEVFGKLCGYIIQHNRMNGHRIRERNEQVMKLRERIENFEIDVDINDIGNVIGIADGVTTVYGLNNVMAGEVVEFDNGAKGLVLNLEEANVGVVVLGSLPKGIFTV